MRYGVHTGRLLLMAAVTAFAAATGARATPTANPPSIDFGDVVFGTTASFPIFITVDPGWDLDGASGTGVNTPFDFSFGSCGLFAGPGSCAVSTIFTPTGLGPVSGTLDVEECPLSGPASFCIPVAIPLTGNGVAKGTASPSTVDFGSVLLGTTVWKPVTITINAGWTSDGATGTGINIPFGLDLGTCILVPGPGTCTVNESFTPTSLGVANAITDVEECSNTFQNNDFCTLIPFSATGIGVTSVVPSVTEPASIALFGVALAGLSRRRRRA